MHFFDLNDRKRYLSISRAVFLAGQPVYRISNRVEISYLPPFGDIPFKLVIPDHLTTGETVGLIICIWEIKLCKPVVVERFRHLFKYGTNMSIVLNQVVNSR